MMKVIFWATWKQPLMLFLACGLLPVGLAGAANITYVVEDIVHDDTTIVKNDGDDLTAMFPLSGATQFVNGVQFQGIQAEESDLANGASYTNWDATPPITVGWLPIPKVVNRWGGTLDDSGVYEAGGWGTKIMNFGIVSDKFQDGGHIPIQVSGLTVGTDYRVQLLMDWADADRTMEVKQGLQTTGAFSVGNLAPDAVGHGVSVSAYFNADATSIDFDIVPATADWQRAVFNAVIVAKNVTAPGQPGDYDGDLDVDGNDLLVWQRGESPNGSTAGDLATWQQNFGVGSSAVIAVSAVPEPASILLVGLALGLVGCCRGSRIRG